jgi:tetratricopeptide (TPR) repeat protein
VKLARAAGGVDISIVDAHEVDLVESVVDHRTRYQQTLRQLHGYYESHGQVDKARWAAFELNGFRGVKQFRYLLDAEVPTIALKPSEQLEEADALFEKGRELMRAGGHGVPGIYREDRMIEAAELFRELIQRYPNSDKVDDAAFLCGEIHKDYLPGQEEIAVSWYERAWTWNPQTDYPARFQAAVVFDYRLHDRARALELYRAAAEHEEAHQANARFATRRIQELTTGTGDSTEPVRP